MEKIRTLNSYVAIEVPYITKNKIDFLGGTLEIAQTDHMREKDMAVSYGKIVAVPLTNTDIHNHKVDADLDIKEGDMAFFDKMLSSRYGRLAGMAEKDTFNLLFEEDGRKVIMIPSRAIIMVKRGEKYIAQNDYIVGTLVDIPKHEFEIHEQKHRDRLRVVSAGKNVVYQMAQKLDTRFELIEGEVAIAGSPVVMPISDEYEKHGLYRLKIRQIIGKVE